MLISKLCHLILESPNKTPLVKFSLVTQSRIHLFKFTNGNTRAMCEICSQLTIKRPEQHYWHRSGVFNCEQILLIVLMFPLLTLNKYITAGKVSGPAILTKKKEKDYITDAFLEAISAGVLWVIYFTIMIHKHKHVWIKEWIHLVFLVKVFLPQVTSSWIKIN